MARGKPEKPFTKENAKSMGKKGGEAKRGHVSIKSAMKRALDEGRVNVDDLVDAFYLHAKDGNPAFAKLILEYTDGRVKEEVEITTTEKTPLTQAIEQLKHQNGK